MELIGLADLEARFDDFVERVEAGEAFAIVRDGKIWAYFGPPQDAKCEDERRAFYDALATERAAEPIGPDSLPLIRGMRGHDDGEAWR